MFAALAALGVRARGCICLLDGCGAPEEKRRSAYTQVITKIVTVLYRERLNPPQVAIAAIAPAADNLNQVLIKF